MLTYIGLRVKRYGPPTTNAADGWFGITLVRARRNSITADAITTRANAINAAARNHRHVDGRAAMRQGHSQSSSQPATRPAAYTSGGGNFTPACAGGAVVSMQSPRS